MLKSWEKINENFILKGKDFYISYLPSNSLANIPIFQADNGGAETAIVKNGEYFILNGDHREAYENFVDSGFDACYKYFTDHIDQKSSWSN